MILNQSDIQFKDYLFINRLNLSQYNRSSHSTVPHLKISRSTWTKKAMRQKQNEQKMKANQNFFEENKSLHSASLSQEHRQSTQAKTIHINQSLNQKNISARQKTQLSKTKHNPSLKIHFTLNRNAYNIGNQEQVPNSRILFQRLENENEPPLCFNKPNCEHRLFLKTLKIKDNMNLYKGNFSKFTKKQISHCIKSKRLNQVNDIDLSPWENDNNFNFYT